MKLDAKSGIHGPRALAAATVIEDSHAEHRDIGPAHWASQVARPAQATGDRVSMLQGVCEPLEEAEFPSNGSQLPA